MNKMKDLYTIERIKEDVVVQNHKILDYNNSKAFEFSSIDGCKYAYIHVTNLDPKLGNFKCVCKRINPSENKKINDCYRELYFLCHLKKLHPSIVEIYGWTDAFIFMEHVEYSSLTVILKKGTLNFNGTEKTKIALGIAHTINYLHKLEIIHCDLSLNNILIDEKKEPKICDFGNTKYFSEDPNHIGTPGYAGPEIFPHSNYKKNTPQSDVYGFGGILWVLATGENPADKYFPTKDSLNYDKLKDESFKHVRFLIKCCRAYHPLQRYTFENIIKLIINGKFVFPDTNFSKVMEYYNRLESQTRDVSEFDP